MNRLALAAALALVPAPTLADTIGTYAAGDGKRQAGMTINYKDDQHIRMDVGQGSYLLMTGAKTYMVTSHGGQPMVMDVDSMPKLGMPMAQPAGKPGDAKVAKTGRSETVAGIKGDVYEIVDAKGSRHEAVFSTDKRAMALNKAFIAMGKRLGQSLGADTAASLDAATREAETRGFGGLLRIDQAMVLQSVKDGSQPSGYYELPVGATPMQMPKMDPAMMQQIQQRMQEAQQRMQQQGR